MDVSPILKVFDTLMTAGAALSLGATGFFIMLAGYQYLSAGGSVRCVSSLKLVASPRRPPEYALLTTSVSFFQRSTARSIMLCTLTSVPTSACSASASSPSMSTTSTRAPREALEGKFRQRSEYMLEYGIPIWVGEFGPVYKNEPQSDAMR